MQLTFEYTLDAGAGLFPQVIHTSDNLLRFIYLTSYGTVESVTADPVLGLYGDLTYEEISRISPDETVSYPSIKRVAHYGAYGFWSAEGDHRFVMYMLPADISNSFVDGSIKYGVSSEVSQMSCTLLNIKGAMLNRYRALVTPGTKMELYFSLGNSGETPLGIFYIDRASVSYPDEKVSVSARNAIGKLLKEQTFNEDNTFEETTLQLNFQEILRLAEVEDFFVGENAKTWKLRFEPDVTILDGIKQILSLLDGWKVDETAAGVIGVAKVTDARFDQPAVYTFERDKTCWSYSVEYDDSEAVSRVCVTCAEPKNTVYADVPRSKWWIQPSHRTAYVTAADGATLAEITAMAEELAQAIAISGRQESFVGIFTPQLTIGDEVRLITGSKYETVGTVVDVTHSFGRGGFYTAFTVDSGGRKGKSRLSDLIGKVSEKPNLNGVTIY
jgi:3-hydroxymyristoyl/3-hydroxydecanoyl-(acyl carrier protein) dehydratase